MVDAGQRAGNIFPPLNIKSSNLHMLETRQQQAAAKSALSGPSIAEQLESGGRVSIQELSWDDKELVLRVLFAKMNGTQSAASQAVRAGVQRGGRQGSQQQQQQQQPVFISEGGNLPPSEYAESAEFQTHFEVQSRGRRVSGSSRLDDRDFQDERDSRRSGLGGGGRSGNSSFNGGESLGLGGGDDGDSI